MGIPPKNKTRLWLIGMVVLSGLADLVTFLSLRQFHIFEINPIYVLSKSVLLMCAVKIGFLIIISIMIYHGSHSRHVNFMLVLGVVYISLYQGLGAYSNLHIVAVNPSPDQAYAPAEAVKTYLWYSVLNYMLPLIIGTIAYWLFDLGGYDKEQRGNKNGTIQQR